MSEKEPSTQDYIKKLLEQNQRLIDLLAQRQEPPQPKTRIIECPDCYQQIPESRYPDHRAAHIVEPLRTKISTLETELDTIKNPPKPTLTDPCPQCHMHNLKKAEFGSTLFGQRYICEGPECNYEEKRR